MCTYGEDKNLQFVCLMVVSKAQRQLITYARSPLILLANWTSFGMMVTLLAWIAHKLVSSNKPTKYASDASCNAKTAEDWNRKSVLKSWAISLTKRWNGNFRMSNSVDFWYLRISLNATVPGRYLCGFLTPPVAGADLRAAFVASCFLGALPPVLVIHLKNKIYRQYFYKCDR